MSEKRFSYNIIRGSRQVIIIDCHTCKSATIDVYDDDFKYFVDVLNEQQATIEEQNKEIEESSAFIIEQRIENKKLKEENEQLKQKVDFYKYFQKDARELEMRMRN